MADGNGAYLHVKNWSRFQHYKQRDPAWIKLHKSLLADYRFGQLSDRDKCHLVLLWLEASWHEGAIPNDPSYLRRRLALHSNPNLKLFINQGFLLENASINGYQPASTSREEKIREEKIDQKPVDKSLERTKIGNQLPAYLYKQSTELK